MATESKKQEAAVAAAPPVEARCLTLRQKLVEMRKACPEIVKKQHSDGVSYKSVSYTHLDVYKRQA